MPTYTATAGDKVTIDPGDPRGAWIIELPATPTNGDFVSIKAKAVDRTPVTVTAAGLGDVVENHKTAEATQNTISLIFDDLMSVRYTYDSFDNSWRVYVSHSARPMEWKSVWAPGSYQPREVVDYEGGLYACIAPTSGNPDDDAASWEVMTPKPGIGVMDISAPVAGPDIGAGWTPITQYDRIRIPGYGITFNTVDGTFQFNFRAVWSLRLQFFLGHDETNQSRRTGLRLFDVTQGIPVLDLSVAIARNQDGSFVSSQNYFDIDQSFDEDVFRFEIGGGDSVSSVVWENLSVQLLEVSK